MKPLRFAIACALLCIAASPTKAHDVGLSTTNGVVRSDALLLTSGFALPDARQLLPEAERAAGEMTPERFEMEKALWTSVAAQLWEISSGGVVSTPNALRVELVGADNVSFHLEFPLSDPSEGIILRALRLAELPQRHRQLVVIIDSRGSPVAKKLLSGADPTVEVPGSAMLSAGQRGEDTPGFWAFLKLGMKHIWIGYDHLLFLLGLLVVCRTFRSAVLIVSSFTIAHSLTLALATWDIIHLSPRWVEPAIAASIVVVGVENLFRRGKLSQSRLVLAFAFGLVHGLGFANVLRDLGVGSGGRGLLLPLFSFNLGVEIGQMSLAAIALPIIWQLRKSASFESRIAPILSGVVVAAGLYWLIERAA